jgi:hypothetical protein
MVVAIRVEDSAIAADSDMPAKDLLLRLELEMGYLECALRGQRMEKSAAKKEQARESA